MSQTRAACSRFRGGITRLLPIAGLLIALATGFAPLDTNAQISAAFTATARADSYQVTVIDPSVPLVPNGTMSSSVSSAQALLNSLGQSQGFAAGPDLGFVATLPPTVNGLLSGQAPPLPDYPLQVASDHPTQQESIQEAGPYRLEARSNAAGSSAQNRMGASTTTPQVMSVISTAEVAEDEATGQILAHAATTTEPIRIADLLGVGRVESTASATFDPGGEPQLESHFAVEALTVAGLGITVDADGVHAADSIVPLDLSGVIGLLAQGGVTLEFVPEVRTATSVVSAGLAISYVQDVPTQGDVTTRIVLGRTAASVDASLPPAPRPVGAVVPPAPALPNPSAPIAPAPPSAVAPVAPVPTPDTAPTPAPPALTSTKATPVVHVLGDWANWRIYLAVVAAALVGLLGTRALGAFGVRLDSANPFLMSDTPSLKIPIS